MGLLLPHFKELSVKKTALLALDNATQEHYIKFALAVIVSSGYNEPADDDHSDNDAGHLAIVEMADALLQGAGTGLDAGNVKKERLGSWSKEYVTGKERVTTNVLPPVVVALLTKYRIPGLEVDIDPTGLPPARFAHW